MRRTLGAILEPPSQLKLLPVRGAISGAVFGASGASIMSTLASAGAVIGGGVVAGIGLVSGGAGAGTAKLLNDHVFEHDKQARIWSYSGAAAGTGCSLGTLLTAGAGPSGLAAVGSIFGGGMAVGAISLLALPVAGAALVGGGVYWHNKKRNEALTRRSSGPRTLRGFLRMPSASLRKKPLRIWRR